MNTNLKDLPIAERVRLVEDLWDSIASDQESLPLTPAQRDELDRRMAAYETDGDIGQPAADVIKDLRSRCFAPGMHSEISWQVELSINREQFDEFRTLTIEMVESTKLEEGVIVYERCFSEDHTRVFVYERYASSEAAIAHLRVFRDKFGHAFTQLAKRQQFLVFGEPTQDLKEILSSFNAKFLSPLDGFSALTVK